MTAISREIDTRIIFVVTVPDGQPEEATPFQGFAYSLCKKHNLLRFIQQMPSDVLELAPEVFPHRVARRMAGQARINWHGQSPRALMSQEFPREMAFTVIFIDENEEVETYKRWLSSFQGVVTLVGKNGGHIRYADLSSEALQARFVEVCEILEASGEFANATALKASISSWITHDLKPFPVDIGGHGTIAPNASVLRFLGYRVGENAYDRHGEGEAAFIEQIVHTTNCILNERLSVPHSAVDQLFPRPPDLNLYLPSTYDLKAIISKLPMKEPFSKRVVQTLKVLSNQNGYSFETTTEGQATAMLGIPPAAVLAGDKPKYNPVMDIRAGEIWLGTEALGCLAVSEIGAVVRLPNRLNRTRGIVRQFAEHYRADRPQILKRSELFNGVQRAISEGVPIQLLELIEKSKDGIRIVADAHLEWLDVKGIPLGLRYNVSRIPVTPGNSFLSGLSNKTSIHVIPEAFQKVLVISGLKSDDPIANHLKLAFDTFDKLWADRMDVTYAQVGSRQDLIAAINAFDGMMMVFDGHGSHNPNDVGVLWLGNEAVDIWELVGEIHRPPPIVILSACDTHAADRNHATVANGFLALGCRSVLASVFPLHASHAAVFAARLLYRVSNFLPAAVNQFGRSLSWLEIVSGMLRRQLVTDILRHLEGQKLIEDDEDHSLNNHLQTVVEFEQSDPFGIMRAELVALGISPERLNREIHTAVASSSTISYLHLGRPETILINTVENVNSWYESEQV